VAPVVEDHPMVADPAEVERDELRDHVRPELLDLHRTVTVHGGPDNVDLLCRHATRTH